MWIVLLPLIFQDYTFRRASGMGSALASDFRICVWTVANSMICSIGHLKSCIQKHLIKSIKGIAASHKLSLISQGAYA